MPRLVLLSSFFLAACSLFAGPGGGVPIEVDLIGRWEVVGYSDRIFSDEGLTKLVATGRDLSGFVLVFEAGAATNPDNKRGRAEPPTTPGSGVEFVWRIDSSSGSAMLVILTVFPCTSLEITKSAPVGGRAVYKLRCVMEAGDGGFQVVEMDLRR